MSVRLIERCEENQKSFCWIRLMPNFTTTDHDRYTNNIVYFKPAFSEGSRPSACLYL